MTLTYGDFIRRYCTFVEGAYGLQVTGVRNVEELRALMAPVFLARRKKEVLADLPPLTWSTVTLSAEPGVMKALLGFEEGVQIDLDEVEQNAMQLSELRHTIGVTKASYVADLIRRELEGGMQKVVVFYWHQQVGQQLADALKSFGPIQVSGLTSQISRSIRIDTFQEDPRVRVFLGQIKACGTSITLTAASDVFFAEASWSPSDNEQAAARCHRIGTINPVLARFITLEGSIDEAVTRVLERKARALSKIFDKGNPTDG